MSATKCLHAFVQCVCLQASEEASDVPFLQHFQEHLLTPFKKKIRLHRQCAEAINLLKKQ